MRAAEQFSRNQFLCFIKNMVEALGAALSCSSDTFCVVGIHGYFIILSSVVCRQFSFGRLSAFAKRFLHTLFIAHFHLSTVEAIDTFLRLRSR